MCLKVDILSNYVYVYIFFTLVLFSNILVSNKNRPLDSIVTKLDFDATLREEQEKNTERRMSEQAVLEMDVKVRMQSLVYSSYYLHINFMLNIFLLFLILDGSWRI